MKRLLATVLALALMLSALSALAEEQITLKVSDLSGGNFIHQQLAAERFMKLYPNVKVEITPYEEDYYFSNGPMIFSSPEKPDLAWYWASVWYEKMAKAGTIIPLNDVYEEFGLNEVLNAETIKGLTLDDGNVYAINTNGCWTPYIFYSKKLFRDLGIEEFPKTVEEFDKVAQICRDNGIIPFMYADYSISDVLFMFMARMLPKEKFLGLCDFSGASDAKFTDPDVVAAWDMFKQWQDKYMPKGAVALKDDEARSMFAQGRLAMFAGGSWVANKETLQGQVTEEFELAVENWPQFDKDIPITMPVFDKDAIMVISGTGKEDWAKKYVGEFMSYETQALTAERIGLIPSRTDMKDEDIQPMGQIMVDVMNIPQRDGTVPYMENEMGGELADRLQEWTRGMLSGQLSAMEAAQNVQTMREQVIAEKQAAK